MKKNPFDGLPTPKDIKLDPPGIKMADLANLRRVAVPPLPTERPIRKPRILIVDDKQEFLDSVRQVHQATDLKHYADFVYVVYNDGNYRRVRDVIEADLNAKLYFDALVVDLNLQAAGEMYGGIMLIKQLRADIPELEYVPVSIMTAYPDAALQRQAIDSKIDRFIIKVEVEQSAPIGVVGTLVHRVITDVPEVLSSAEDRFWFDLNERVARRIIDQQNLEDICRFAGEELNRHFRVHAIYARRIEGDPNARHLRLIGGHDGFAIGIDKLKLEDVTFIRDFLEGPDQFKRVDSLTTDDIGRALAPKLVGCRALLARMSIGTELIGAITIYRSASDRTFRSLDGAFSSLLAQQLGAALYSREQVRTLEKRQGRLPQLLQDFANASEERIIFNTAQRALHDYVAEPASPSLSKTTIRAVIPGTDRIPRQSLPLGYQTINAGNDIALSMEDRSTVAAVMTEGVCMIDGDVHPHRTPRFYFSDPLVRSHLTVPILSQSVCLGVANMESRVPHAFTARDLQFAESLCVAAADSVIRLRSMRFAIGMAGLLDALTIDRGQSRQNVLNRAVRLLFEYTGYAELIYAVPEGSDRWKVVNVYGREGLAQNETRIAKWDKLVRENWEKTFMHYAVQGGEAVTYTEDESHIFPDHQMREDNVKTRAEAVVLIRDDGGSPPKAFIALLFVQKFALSQPQRDMLRQFATVLARLLDRETRVGKLFGELNLRAQNARLGQALIFVRHSLQNKISLMRQFTVKLDEADARQGEVRKSLLKQLDHATWEVARGKNLVKERIERKPVKLSPLWKKVTDELAGVATETGGTVKIGRFDVKQWRTDADILSAILINLAHNALHHGGKGTSVTLHSHLVDGRLALDVIDTGKGVAQKIQDRLFEVGNTTDSSSTGAGLSLSRGRAQDMDGDLELMPTAKGALFRVSLPR